MPDIINPYIPGRPVEDPKLFFGRRDEISALRESLVKGRRVFVVSGPPRIGKSSLLLQLPRLLPDPLVTAAVEFLEEDVQQLDWLLYRLAQAIAHRLTLPAPAWSDFEARPSQLLDRFWPQARRALGDGVLVLLLDDLDLLEEGDPELLEGFLSALALWREREPDLALVVAADEGLASRLSRQHPRLFGGALTLNLGALSSEDSVRLVTWPVEGVLTYDFGVARRLVELTSGQPYFLHLICFEVFNRCAAAGWVNQRDLDLVLEDLVGREIADFHQIWDGATPQEQATLAALVTIRGARGMATVQETHTLLTKAGARVHPDQVMDALERLTARGILEQLGALSYRFRVALLRDWLAQRIDLESIVRSTRWPTANGRQATAGPRKLSISRHGSPAAPPPPSDQAGGEEAVEPPETAQAAPPAPVSRRWPALAGLAALALLVLALVLVPPLLESPPAQTPLAALTAPPTAPLAAPTSLGLSTATLTPKAVVGSPSATVAPSDTPLPSPTPPVVIARPAPAIAYQARERGDDRWFLQVMSADGTHHIRLAEGQSEFLSPPSWSPDGTRLAFASDRDGYDDIWIIDIDGDHLTNLTNDEARDHSPAWSPDGQWIAFASVRDSLYWELYLMRPDGSDLHRLTWWDDASDLSPSWSPDGERLTFASKRDDNWEIYVMDRDGSHLTRLTRHEADDTNPDWSPDGSRIAFASTREGYAEIYVMALGRGEAINISKAPFSAEYGPTWSPDGSRIAFYSDRDGGWNVYAMGADGSDVVRLTGGDSNDQVPAWRP
jgi:TolB protein